MYRRTFISQLLSSVSLPLAMSSCFYSLPPLTVGTQPWIGYESLFLARQFAWLPSHIKLQEYKTTQALLEAVQTGTLDAATLTLDEVLLARGQELPLTVVLIFDISAGANMLVVHPQIETLAELKGKRLGLNHSPSSVLIASSALQSAELSKQDVTLLDIPLNQQFSAWATGKVDALITCEPTASLLRMAGAFALFDSRQMPNMIFNVLAVRSDRLFRRETQLRSVLTAHFRALQYLKINRQDAMYRVATHQHIYIDGVEAALAGMILPSLHQNQYYLSSQHDDKRLTQAAHTLSHLMVEHNLLAQPDTLNALFDARFLPTKKVEAW